jgi:hypothetical protein
MLLLEGFLRHRFTGEIAIQEIRIERGFGGSGGFTLI